MEQITFSNATGTLQLKKQLIRSVSGHRESVILNFSQPDQELLDQAVQAARSYASEFLIMEIDLEQREHQQLLQENGFQLESVTIATDTSDFQPPPDSPYRVRPPQPADHFAVAVLNSTVISHTLSSVRDYDLSELTFRSLDDTFRRVSRQDDKAAALILTQGKSMAGYLLLELHPDRGYIYDLAIEPAHWGGKAANYIMRSASSLLFHKGIPLMTGDVSASNLRALKYAFRFLGFKVIRERYGLKL